MAQRIFTKGEVDYLVAALKFIRTIPQTRPLDATSQKGWKISTEVFSKADPSRPIRGLVIIAKAHEAPTGLPHPPPSTALEWFGKRIRGLNYELRHDNPDGSIVEGWHEHVWSPIEQDARVIEARPELRNKRLLDVLNWGLNKWNIEVLAEQGKLHDDVD